MCKTIRGLNVIQLTGQNGIFKKMYNRKVIRKSTHFGK